MCEEDTNEDSEALKYSRVRYKIQKMFEVLLKMFFMCWNLFLVSTIPKRCVRKLLKRDLIYYNMFLMSTGLKRCMKELL